MRLAEQCLFLSTFDGMKHWSRHAFFWILYWALLAYFEYIWLQGYIEAWPAQKMATRAVAGSFFYMLVHLAFAYFLVYFALGKIVQNQRKPLYNAAMILLPYLSAICLIVVMAHQIVLPLIYENIVVPKGIFIEPPKFFSIMIETAFPAGLLMATQFVHYQLAARERETRLIKEKLSTELQLLKNQMNPHFLFNTLNNIYALTRKKSDQAPDAVLKLSELLSFMLYESGSDSITIDREVAFLTDYIAIQQLRFSDKLSLAFTRDIDDPAQPIAPLLLLPLVENAFKHGASENHFDSFINLHLQVRQGKLSFVVENSFEEQAGQRQPASIGLTNTSRQLELLYREQSLQTSKTNQVFKVALDLNLHSYGKV